MGMGAPDRFGIVGKVIARTYQVEDVVAEGGFGVVYRAYHRGFRAKVALKCLKIPQDLSEEQRQKFLEQFRSEAEVLFRLSSQIASIVRPLHVDAFHTDDRRLVPFTALEWLEGRTLDAVISRRSAASRPPLTLETLARLLAPVALGLEQAHHLPGQSGTMSVVHRDLKPENLFIARVGEDDVAKILDFGISKVKSAADQLAGRASQTAGDFSAFSPAYGAPEQWAPKRFGQTGRWTDVWGLALTMVEAAKGLEVITGDHAEMMGTIIDPARRPTPRTEGIVVSDAVESIFARALAVDPRQRQQTVGEFWDALTEALGLASELGKISMRSQPEVPRRERKADTFGSIAPPAPAPASLARPAVGQAGATAAPRAVGKAARPEEAPRPPLPSGPRLLAGDASVGPLAISLAPSSVRPPSPSGRARMPSSAYGSSPYASVRPRPSLLRGMSSALSLMALSVACTVLDRAFLAKHGQQFALGPLKASWIAGLFMVFALVSGFRALRRNLNDGT